MSIGKSGKESGPAKRSTKTLVNSKTPCFQAPSMEQKGEDMDRMKLINILSRVIQDISDKDGSCFHWKEGKIKFRQYERMGLYSDQLRAIDVTIEA